MGTYLKGANEFVNLRQHTVPPTCYQSSELPLTVDPSGFSLFHFLSGTFNIFSPIVLALTRHVARGDRVLHG